MNEAQTQETPQLSAEEELRQAFLSGQEAAETPPEAPPAAPAQPDQPTAPPASPPAGDWTPREFTFKRNGQEVSFRPSSPEEELEFIRKGYDYTQKTMELAEERKQLQAIAKELAEREQNRQASLRAFLTNPELVERYLQTLRNGGQPPAAPINSDPDAELEPVSKADLDRIVADAVRKAEERAAAKAKEESEKTFKALLDQAATEKLSADFRTDLTATAKALVSQHPELEYTDGIEDLLLQAGQRFFYAHIQLHGEDQPVDPALIKQAMAEDARNRAARVAARLREKEKAEAVQRAAVTTRGTEPPGGNAPTIPQGSSKRFRLNDPDLDAQVIKEIQSMIK